jgi:hypothetical protein
MKRRRITRWNWYEVSFWSHNPVVNDCVGNSHTWKGKARTPLEAAAKAKKQAAKKELGIWFRLRHSKTI